MFAWWTESWACSRCLSGPAEFSRRVCDSSCFSCVGKWDEVNASAITQINSSDSTLICSYWDKRSKHQSRARCGTRVTWCAVAFKRRVTSAVNSSAEASHWTRRFSQQDCRRQVARSGQRQQTNKTLLNLAYKIRVWENWVCFFYTEVNASFAHTVTLFKCCDCCKITEVVDLINDSSSHDDRIEEGVWKLFNPIMPAVSS